jgi:hypothetical protein
MIVNDKYEGISDLKINIPDRDDHGGHLATFIHVFASEECVESPMVNGSSAYDLSYIEVGNQAVEDLPAEETCSPPSASNGGPIHVNRSPSSVASNESPSLLCGLEVEKRSPRGAEVLARRRAEEHNEYKTEVS